MTRILSLAMLLLLACACCACWTALLGTWFIRYVLWQQYIVPMIDRTARAHYVDTIVRNHDATYYHRQCTAYDVTILEQVQDLVIDDEKVNLHDKKHNNKNDGVETLMTYGVGILPRLLSPDTVQALHAYMTRRNELLHDDEAIFWDPPKNRKAFAPDPGEDPVLIQALSELTSNPTLQRLLRNLLGDDNPAITELSVLTSFAGARPQGWHHDVIVDDGSALLYSRTYQHTYSLFVALQDTTADMGATWMCPGSHVCTNEEDGWIIDTCQAYGRQPILTKKNATTAEPVWAAGDGVLFNQQICHRGGRHEKQTPPRIMLVLSFASRPDLAVDSRVLPKGLYTYVLWHVWGLTLQDLVERTVTATSRFWRRLRSLGIYQCERSYGKNYTENYWWGIDWITKSVMYWTIRENGMTLKDLVTYVDAIHANVLPRLFHGSVPMLDEMKSLFGNDLEGVEEAPGMDLYKIYLESVMEQLTTVLGTINLALFVALIIYIATQLPRRSSSSITSSSLPLSRRWFLFMMIIVALVYIGPVLLMSWHWHNIRHSNWGRNIESGLSFREPFPRLLHHTRNRNLFVDARYNNFYGNGPTTMPERNDVLLTTRLHSLFLGSYATTWIHPGNVAYQKEIISHGRLPTHHAEQNFNSSFVKHFVKHVASKALLHGQRRLLHQNWRTGDWHVVKEIDMMYYQVCVDLVKSHQPVLDLVDSTISQLLAHNRFDVPHREMALAMTAQSFLVRLRHDHFLEPWCTSRVHPISALLPAVLPDDSLQPLRNAVVTNPFRKISSRKLPCQKLVPLTQIARRPRWTTLYSARESVFQGGDLVLIDSEGTGEFLYRATILQLDSTHSKKNEMKEVYLVGYEFDTSQDTFPRNRMYPLRPMEEGVSIWCLNRDGEDEDEDDDHDGHADDEAEHDYRQARIERIKPDGSWDVTFKDGNKLYNVKPYDTCDYSGGRIGEEVGELSSDLNRKLQRIDS